MIDRHRDQISGTVKRTSERRISAPSLEKFSGGTTPSQTVPATLQYYVQGSTIIPSSTLLENVMRKPRDFDGELKALQEKARDLKSRKVQQLGELVIATGADSLSVDELAGALIVLTETKDAGKREAWARRGAAFFQSRARRTAPAAERHTGGARAQPGGAQPSMAGGAETPNIAALPAIARLGARESARGPDADRRVKLLIQFAVEGSLSGAYSHMAARHDDDKPVNAEGEGLQSLDASRVGGHQHADVGVALRYGRSYLVTEAFLQCDIDAGIGCKPAGKNIRQVFFQRSGI
jgi:hypothetical protein